MENDEKFLVELIDQDGEKFTVEHLDTLEHNGKTYMAFLPAEMQLDDSYDLIILRAEYNEELHDDELLTIEDEDELNEVFDLFSERLEDSFEDED